MAKASIPKGVKRIRLPPNAGGGDGWGGSLPLRHDYPDTIELDATAVEFVVPTFLLRLRTFVDWHRHYGRTVRVIPPSRRPVRSYLARMKIDEGLPDGTIPHLPQVNAEKRSEVLIPVRPLWEFVDVDNLTELELWPVLHNHFADVAALADAMHMAVSELCANGVEHGTSETGCYVAAQRYPQERKLVLAIADLGVGIPEHLRKRYPDLSTRDGQAIVRATEEHVTGTGDKVRGRGFTEVLDAAAEAGVPSGEMRIRSCHGLCRIRVPDKKLIHASDVGYKRGTWITLELGRR